MSGLLTTKHGVVIMATALAFDGMIAREADSPIYPQVQFLKQHASHISLYACV